MSVTLLDHTRKISSLLHDNSSRIVIFNDICECLGNILSAGCMVVSAKGKVLGLYEHPDAPDLTMLLRSSVGVFIDADLNNRFLSVLSTKENVNLELLGFERDVAKGSKAILLPVYFAGERMGTTFIFRERQEFGVDDIILSEYANTVIELTIMRALYEEDEEEERRRTSFRSAMESLSGTEQRAIEYLLRELPGTEGSLVTSKIAARYGITRSIIVNALRKLEGAGVLETKSMGMRGTYIRIINDAILKNGMGETGDSPDEPEGPDRR